MASTKLEKLISAKNITLQNERKVGKYPSNLIIVSSFILLCSIIGYFTSDLWVLHPENRELITTVNNQIDFSNLNCIYTYNAEYDVDPYSNNEQFIMLESYNGIKKFQSLVFVPDEDWSQSIIPPYFEDQELVVFFTRHATNIEEKLDALTQVYPNLDTYEPIHGSEDYHPGDLYYLHSSNHS